MHDDTRHYGLELEYIGVPLDKVADIIRDIVGGEIRKQHSTRLHVESEKGDFIVELDVELAQKISEKAKAHREENPAGRSLEEMADQIVPPFLSPIAPSEIVTPPLKYNDLDIVEKLIVKLRDAGAQGTSKSLFYAFGYHINAEAASFAATEIRDTLRAFILMYDWLMTRLEMDLTRKITGFAGPHDKKYIELVLKPDYNPNLEQLIRDYIQLNPSRNYALDMLPLFSHLDEKLVDDLITESLIKKRPTYHFRMPNCCIDDTQWNIRTGLNCWFTVEALADDKALLRKLSAEYIDRRQDVFSRIDKHWAEKIETELRQAGILS